MTIVWNSSHLKFLLKKLFSSNKCDKCVICNNATKYTNQTNILSRKGYIVGVGQLCEDCFYDICLKNSK